jgi:hypothetical protein
MTKIILWRSKSNVKENISIAYWLGAGIDVAGILQQPNIGTGGAIRANPSTAGSTNPSTRTNSSS